MNTTIGVAGRAKTHPNLILGICCLSLLMVAMDATIVNVALPSIRHDLAASISGLQWVIDAYTMVVASLLMLAGSMADRFGRRRVFQSGMALFMLGSLAVQCCSKYSWPGRISRCAGAGRDDAQSGRHVDHCQYVPRTESTCARHRHMGRGRGCSDGTRSGDRRRAHAKHWLAFDLLGEPAGRCRGDVAGGALHSGVQGAASATRRSDRTAAWCSSSWPR